jgi:hypothetical protein
MPQTGILRGLRAPLHRVRNTYDFRRLQQGRYSYGYRLLSKEGSHFLSNGVRSHRPLSALAGFPDETSGARSLP